MISCPSAADFEQFLDEALPEIRQEQVAAHLSDCTDCQSLLEQLTDETDPRIRAYQAVVAKSSALASATTIIGRSRKTTPEPAPRSPVPSPAGYEILGEVGRGGMGVVYKARHRRLNRIVALKMVLAGAHASPEQLVRFLGEAEIVAGLRHPHIVQIHEVGQHDCQPFLALEYVDGGSLAERLTGVTYPPRSSAALMEQLARAVHHAHQQGIIHRDLKPSNILLQKDEGGRMKDEKSGFLNSSFILHPSSFVPRIADFGLAKQMQGSSDLTPSHAVMGTPQYMAPEQASGGSHGLGPAVDVYSLGAILYELLTGRPPFQAATPMETILLVVSQDPIAVTRLQPGIPRDLATICMKCLHKEPGRRYLTAEALANDLRRFLDGEPVQARPVGEWERVWKWARRRPAVAGLMVTLALTLLAATAVSTYFGIKAEDRALLAEAARRNAERAEEDALRTKYNSDMQAADLTFRAGLAEAEAGKVDRGLFTLLQLVRTAPDNPEFHRVLRTNLIAWIERLPVLQQIIPGQEKPIFLCPDGAAFATCADNVVRRWETFAAGPVERPAFERTFPGKVIGLSPDGEVTITQETLPGGSHVCLYHTATGDPCGKPLSYPDDLAFVAFAPGNRILALTGAGYRELTDRRTRFWRVPSGEPVGPEIEGDFYLLRARDGRLVLMMVPTPDYAQPFGPAARFWDLDSDRPLTGFDPAPDPGAGDRRVAFDGRWLLTVTFDGRVHWWDPATGEPRRQPWQPARLRNYGPALLTADARTLAVCCNDARVRWYDIATGQECGASVGMPDSCQGMDIRADGTALLFSSNPGGIVRLWRINDLHLLHAAGVTPRRQRREVAYSPDRRRVFTSDYHLPSDRYSGMLDIATDGPVGGPLRGPSQGPVLSADGTLLATHTTQLPGVAPVAQVWDAVTGKPRTLSLPSSSYIHSLAFSPDQRTLAVGCVNRAILYDLATSESRFMLTHESAVSQLAFSPDGKWLATGSRAGWTGRRSGFRIWEVSTGQAVGEYVLTTDAPRFWFSQDSRTLCTLELHDGRLRRWDCGTGAPAGAVLHLHPGQTVECARFRADGKGVLGGSLDGTAQEWDTGTGRPLTPAMHHPAPVVAVAYSPNFQTLAVGCRDGTARLWDAATGKPVSPPLTHRGSVQGLTFTPEGDRLLTTSIDGATHSWALVTPAQEEPEMLELWLQAIVGEQPKGEAVIPLPADAWRELRQRLRERWPEADASLRRSPDFAVWHGRRAKEAERQGDRFGTRWHLDRLVSAQPDNWLLQARRAHIHAAAGRFEAADRDYAVASALATGKALERWIAHRAADSLAAERWSIAVWYLDRLIALRPEDGHAYADRAEAYTRLGQEAQARADLARAAELRADEALPPLPGR